MKKTEKSPKAKVKTTAKPAPKAKASKPRVVKAEASLPSGPAFEETLAFIEGVKRRWMATVDAIIDPLMVVDKDYRVIQANRALAQRTGRDIKEVLGMPCYKVFANRKAPCAGCKLVQSIEKRQTQTFDLSETGKNQYFEVTAQPLFDANGEIEGSLQIYRDRTLAKQLQNQLVQTEKLASIGLLAGGIAHELNNPLGGILLFSQMLLRTVDKQSDYYQDVLEIENAAKRCKAIVENLLDFARQQPAAQLESSKEVVNLHDALAAALRFSTVGGKTDRYEIQEKYDLSHTATTIGNRNKIMQVFLNLIQNAMQAMPRGGRLLLSVRSDARWNVVSIEDNGVGISPENIKKIFDPFYTSKAEGEGTGLGLSICHGIMEELGGRIEVKSKLKKGTTFLLHFPVAQTLREAV